MKNFNLKGIRNEHLEKHEKKHTLDLNSLKISHIKHRYTTDEINMKNVYVLHNIKTKSKKYKTLVISRYERFFLIDKSINQLMNPLTRFHDFNIKRYIKNIANYNQIYQHIPYVNKNMTLLPLKSTGRNDLNNSWVAAHNIASISQPKEKNSAIITFKDEALPNIKVPVNSYYLERRNEDAKIIKEEMQKQISLYQDIYHGTMHLDNNYQTIHHNECLPTYIRRKQIESTLKWAEYNYNPEIIIQADHDIQRQI